MWALTVESVWVAASELGLGSPARADSAEAAAAPCSGSTVRQSSPAQCCSSAGSARRCVQSSTSHPSSAPAGALAAGR